MIFPFCEQTGQLVSQSAGQPVPLRALELGPGPPYHFHFFVDKEIYLIIFQTRPGTRNNWSSQPLVELTLSLFSCSLFFLIGRALILFFVIFLVFYLFAQICSLLCSVISRVLVFPTMFCCNLETSGRHEPRLQRKWASPPQPHCVIVTTLVNTIHCICA